jgi:hypothetical protein
MAIGIETRGDSLQVGAARPLFEIQPPRPDGSNFDLGPDGERLSVWTNQKKQSDTVLNLAVH